VTLKKLYVTSTEVTEYQFAHLGMEQKTFCGLYTAVIQLGTGNNKIDTKWPTLTKLTGSKNKQMFSSKSVGKKTG